MTAVRELIAAAVEAALADAAPLVESMPSGDPDVFPALAIYDTGQQVTETEPGTDRDSMEILVEGYIESADGPHARAGLNELHAEVVRRMFADESFGNLAEVVTKGDLTVLVAELSSARRLAFIQRFTIQFATRRGDPSQLA